MKSKNKAILYVLCSAFCFALMNTFVKLSGDIPSIQKSFFRNFVALIFAFIIIMHERKKVTIQKRNLPFLFIRSFMGTIGVLCNFYAVDHLVLSDASILNKLSPFFAILFSYIFLHEKLKSFQVFGLFAAFIGAILIIKPANSISAFPAFIGMFGGLCAGAAYTAVRFLGQRGEKGSVIVLFFSGFSCLVTLPVLIFDYTPMSAYQVLMLMLAGLSAAGGQFSITAAYSNAPAREISVYDYTQVIFSAIMGFFLFSQVPDTLSVLGYIIICGVSIIMYKLNLKTKA